MTADTIGGVWTYSIELAAALEAHDYEFVIVTMGDRLTADQWRQVAALSNVEIIESDFRLEWMEDPWDDVDRAGEWLLELDEELRPDLIHLNGYSHGALAWRAPTIVVAHSCVFSWWNAVHGEDPPEEWSEYRSRVEKGLEAASVVVAPTRAMLAAVERHYRFATPRTVLRNGFTAAAREELKKEPLVLAAGRFGDRSKNLAVACAAAGQLEWPLHLAGAEGEAGNVQFLGRLAHDQMQQSYGRASIFLHPALYEPFGLAPLEAAGAGAALVLADIDTLRELWDGAALFFDPRDPAALAAAVNRLSGDRLELERQQKAARERAASYSARQFAAAYASLYGKLVHRRPEREGAQAKESTARHLMRRRSRSARAVEIAGNDRPPRQPGEQKKLRFVLFYHSLVSDWNHGNAHFLRGVVAELQRRGHSVTTFEPRDSWSLQNLLEEHGHEPILDFHRHYPGLMTHRYDVASLDLDRALDGADVVLVHEWSDHDLVMRIGEHRRRNRGYQLLFHDTHHRSVTDPKSMARYELSHYDGVLAFGEEIRQIYLDCGWTQYAWTWHEAADVRLFRPRPSGERESDICWIGNWGDGERTAELQEFLVDPARELSLKGFVHGVRYPRDGRAMLEAAGLEYRGWLPNFRVPQAFARAAVTVHIPRRPYVEALPGIPTIRPFEAMACGIPLIVARWHDAEGLFTPGSDFLSTHSCVTPTWRGS
jgi:spore maturation protein CgeB